MRVRRLRLPMAGLAAAAVSSAALIGAGTAEATPNVSVLARGLNSPSHLTFGPRGDLYVAVAGVGGPRYDCERGIDTQGTPTRFCSGSTGAIDRITRNGVSTPMFKLFPSARAENTGEVTGVTAVAFHGNDAATLNANTQSDQMGESDLGGPDASLGADVEAGTGQGPAGVRRS